MSENIFPLICPKHGAVEYWCLPDAQRVCEICFPRRATPPFAAIPVNEDHLYKQKRKIG